MTQKLFQEGKIGKLTLKNRIVMPAMGTGFADYNGEASEEIIRYYEARAKGGCGLIITEITRIDDESGIGISNQLGVTQAYQMKRLSYLADAVHQYGTKIFVQLHHPGRQTPSRLLNGHPVVAPSPIPCKVVQEMPRELTVEEIQALVKKFVMGAYFVKNSGCDGVELHAAHGYLISQFLSPYTNKRTDQYGGDFEGRTRFLTEIILGIQKTLGPNFPIIVRMNGKDFLEGGLELEDQVKLAKYLESLGVAAINVSCGMYESGWSIVEPAALPEGWKKDLAKTIRDNVNIPVIAVNNIKHPEVAEQMLDEGVCDFVGIARNHLADPEYANKAKAGNTKSIRKCIGCLYCFKVLNEGKQVACTVNPLVGREYLYNERTLVRNGEGKKVAVIGGGPAGMQAAIVLAKRGYKPVIFEKSDRLGGSVNLADQPPYKGLLAEFCETLQYELEEAQVEVKLNTEITAQDLDPKDYYGVAVTIGGVPFVPPIEGVDSDSVYIYDQVLGHKVNLEGKKVLVVGGGETGLETAEYLADAGNQVTVVEMLKAVGQEMYTSVLGMMMKRYGEKGVQVITGNKVVKYADGQVTLCDMASNEEQTLDVDALVISSGVKADPTLAHELREKFDRVMVAGDADTPGNIAEALKEAHDQAFVF